MDGIGDIVDESLAEFAELQRYRSTFAAQWDEAAQLLAPEYRNTFYYGSFNVPGEKKTERQVDGSGMLALARFGAILDSMLTPQNAVWHTLRANNDDLMRNKRVAVWFDTVTKLLFQERYAPHANFTAQNQGVFRSLGAFGNGIMYPDHYYAPNKVPSGLRYRNVPLGEMFFKENFQGQVDGFCRWFRLTKRQAIQQFGAEALPKDILASERAEQQFEFLQRVCPRADYEEGRLDDQGMPFASYYISLTGRHLVSAGGYRTFPCAITRYTQVNGIEAYGRGPAQQVLPALKTLNSQKTDFLTQGHMAVDPVYLTTDDGVVDWTRQNGALNKGGLGPNGELLVRRLETGDIQTSMEMMAEEKGLIDAAFLVDLFKILLDDPKIFSATQVIEMTSQRGILIAPTIGRQQSEYLGPLVDRELDLLSEQMRLPPMPPELAEAAGEYKVVYTNPLAKTMRANELAGLNRTLDMAIQVAQITGDPTTLFYFNWDVILPEAADINSVPARWIATPEQVEEKKQGLAQSQQQQAEIQAAPAAAAMMKAKAVAQKTGAT